MEVKSKYVGNVYDGRWKVTGTVYINEKRKIMYILKNIYNGREIKMSSTSMKRIHDGETTVSYVMSSRINRNEGRFGRRNWRGFAHSTQLKK